MDEKHLQALANELAKNIKTSSKLLKTSASLSVCWKRSALKLHSMQRWLIILDTRKIIPVLPGWITRSSRCIYQRDDLPQDSNCVQRTVWRRCFTGIWYQRSPMPWWSRLSNGKTSSWKFSRTVASSTNRFFWLLASISKVRRNCWVCGWLN